jgi:hypothetical protein
MPETETQLATPAEAVTVVSPILELVTGAGLQGERAATVAAIFEDFDKQAEQWMKDAAAINVTDITQVDDMKLARESRLKLKHIRGLVEKKRVDLKADINTRGNAIQAAANHLRDIFKDMESHLQESEDFEKRYLADLREKQMIARTEEVVNLGGNPQMLNLAAMNDEQFAECIQGLKDQAAAKAQREADEKAAADKAAADRKEAARIAEEARLKKEADDLEERKRIADENARLKAEADKAEADKLALEAKQKAEADERDRVAAKEKADRAAAEQEAADERTAKAKAEQDKRDAKAKEERETREAIEAAERKQHELVAGRQEALADLGKVVGFTQLSKLSDDDYATLLNSATVEHAAQVKAEADEKAARQKLADDAAEAEATLQRLKAEKEERDRIAAAKERERLTAQIDDAAKVDADAIEAHAIAWAKQNPEVEDGEVKYIAAVITYLETAAQIA